MEQADFACVVGHFMLSLGTELRNPVFFSINDFVGGRKNEEVDNNLGTGKVAEAFSFLSPLFLSKLRIIIICYNEKYLLTID